MISFPKQSVCVHEKDWRMRGTQATERIASVQRQFFSRTLLSQLPTPTRFITIVRLYVVYLTLVVFMLRSCDGASLWR